MIRVVSLAGTVAFLGVVMAMIMSLVVAGTIILIMGMIMARRGVMRMAGDGTMVLAIIVSIVVGPFHVFPYLPLLVFLTSV